MANKLKKMKLSSVDLVKRGANQHAHIMLAKSDEAEGGETKVNKAVGEAFKFCFALCKSFQDIIENEKYNLEKKQELMNENLCDFNEEVAKQFSDWSDEESVKKSFELSEDGTAVLKAAQETLYSILEPTASVVTENPPQPKEKEIQKEEFDMALIDITKMSPEDIAVLEELKKKYAEEGDDEPEKKEPEINPEVKKALEELEELKKSLAVEQMKTVAAKYEVIGKSVDETAEMLYNLKKSNEDAYATVIKAYDELVDTASNSDVFKEFGSNRSGNTSGSDLEGIVSELRKSDPSMTREKAIIKAFEINPNIDPMTGKLK